MAVKIVWPGPCPGFWTGKAFKALYRGLGCPAALLVISNFLPAINPPNIRTSSEAGSDKLSHTQQHIA